MSIVQAINLLTNVKSRSTIVKCNVVERVGTKVILGWDFCDVHVEAIRRRKRVINLADGTIVPISKGPHKCSKNTVPITEDQEYTVPKCHLYHKLYVSKTVIWKPGTQNGVKFSTLQAGFVQVKPYQNLYQEKEQCSTMLHTGMLKSNPEKVLAL